MSTKRNNINLAGCGFNLLNLIPLRCSNIIPQTPIRIITVIIIIILILTIHSFIPATYNYFEYLIMLEGSRNFISLCSATRRDSHLEF